MYDDIIKLLNLEQCNVKFQKINTTKSNNILHCYITLIQVEMACQKCGNFNKNIHDYRIKKIRHSISTNNPCFLIYRARRYKCKLCNTIYYENNPFTLKNDRNSIYTVSAV